MSARIWHSVDKGLVTAALLLATAGLLFKYRAQIVDVLLYVCGVRL